MDQSKDTHLGATHRVMHYLKKTLRQGLFFPIDNDMQLKVFVMLIGLFVMIHVNLLLDFASSLVPP